MANRWDCSSPDSTTRRSAEDEFNDWYDTEHVPERQRTTGFINCERWLGADDPKISIATYDLDTLDVLAKRGLSHDRRRQSVAVVEAHDRQGAAHLPLRSRADRAGTAGGPAGRGRHADLRHERRRPKRKPISTRGTTKSTSRALLTRAGLPDVRGGSGSWKAVSEGKQRYLAVYHLTGPEVCSSKEWKEAVGTDRGRPRCGRISATRCASSNAAGGTLHAEGA